MIEKSLQTLLHQTITTLYGQNISLEQITLQRTRKEFEGDFTFVVFPILNISKQNPQQTAEAIGKMLIQVGENIINKYNVVKGFLNITLSDTVWIDFLSTTFKVKNYGFTPITESSPTVMVEFSSPNTNKPLHLGHIRNNLLGNSVSEILKAAGNKVIKVTLVNDRGVHICKSMVAWQLFGNGETPEKSGKKGDHLVGDYYVKFDKEYKAELKKLQKEKNCTTEEAEQLSELMQKVKNMLVLWEKNDPEVIGLWKLMNGWVYDGFEVTYKKLGITFDHVYYESKTYLLGKQMVEMGLEKGVFYQKDDQSIWIDLTEKGLDHKLVQRSDGTSVYITQDLGTAFERFQKFTLDKHIYVVGNEQNYHFNVLKLILAALGLSWEKNIYHLSYGMVELPEGKMKSREGTVVDADDLLVEMYKQAVEISQEQGKLNDLSQPQQDKIREQIGLAALKYFILKVDPKKTMLFDPKESIDFNGNTGPFIQYTCTRITSIIKKASVNIEDLQIHQKLTLQEQERSLLWQIAAFPQIITDSAENLSPAMVANYLYETAKEYNRFYHDCPILSEKDEAVRNFRLVLSVTVFEILKRSLSLLGIDVPEKM